jgi:hypothetical protein
MALMMFHLGSGILGETMSEDQTNIRDSINSELKRVQIQNHPNFPAWYASLKPHARQVLDLILEDDVSPELIAFAQESPEEEWNEFQFLRVIGGGNPNPNVQAALTNFSLGDILISVEDFGKVDEE